MYKITLRVTAMNDDMEFLKTKPTFVGIVYIFSHKTPCRVVVNERLFLNAKQYFKYWFNPTIVIQSTFYQYFTCYIIIFTLYITWKFVQIDWKFIFSKTNSIHICHYHIQIFAYLIHQARYIYPLLYDIWINGFSLCHREFIIMS